MKKKLGFTSFQMSLSTAEEEMSYFTGDTVAPPQTDINALIPPGVYRVVDGELRRIVPGVPPSLPLRTNS